MPLKTLRILAWTMAGAAMPLVGWAQPTHAHAHGIARLGISMEQQGFLLRLDSPLDNLVGFERAPRNKKEEDAVRAMAGRLQDAGGLVKANAEAGCTPGQVKLASDVLPGELLGNPGKPTAKRGGAHADLEGTFEFRCTAPQALRALDFGGLFSQFRRLERIDVQLVSEKGQAKRTLTRTRRELGL